MSDEVKRPEGPDFAAGVNLDSIPDGEIVRGRVGDDPVLLVRRRDEVFAVGAECTHYHGPLADGILVGDTLRCPWHHACFSLRTGEALAAPALDPVACWRVDRQGGRIVVREQLPERAPRPAKPARGGRTGPVVILGGGAAGLACADMLRREGFDGRITMISADDAPPCDRPNLSKDYLAGAAPEEWIPLRAAEYFRERGINLLLSSRAAGIETGDRRVVLEGGASHAFDTLVIATGAEPVRLQSPGAGDGRVLYLRTLADSRAIIARAADARRVAVVGASFIGLEVAASLRARNLEVDVVAPEQFPMERVLGPALGSFIRRLHEDHGVVFHLGNTVRAIEGRSVRLSGGNSIEADFVVAGVGVRPALELAESAGIAVDLGIAVNEYLETNVTGIFAAGDVARWPDPRSGGRIRVEHWAVAQRQGQTVAKNILGQRARFDAVPFFWSQHYDVAINYVGHAERWDHAVIDGSMEDRDCEVTFMEGSRTLAVATISRDRRSLEAEVSLGG